MDHCRPLCLCCEVNSCLGKRMTAVLFYALEHTKNSRPVKPQIGIEGEVMHDLRLRAFSKRACLVEDNGVQIACFLECLSATLDENPALRCHAAADEQCGRCCETQSTRTRNHKDGDGELQ